MIKQNMFSSIINNPMFKALANSNNPKAMVMNLIKNSPNANTEVGNTLIALLEKNDMAGLEQYCKNLANSQGIDIDQFKNISK